MLLTIVFIFVGSALIFLPGYLLTKSTVSHYRKKSKYVPSDVEIELNIQRGYNLVLGIEEPPRSSYSRIMELLEDTECENWQAREILVKCLMERMK